MSLQFYKAYMNSVAQDPVDYWKELRQEATNDVWTNTSTVSIIKGQSLFGSLVFADESVQLNSVIDPKTGNQLGDEYRKIIYKSVADSKISGIFNNIRYLGKYYQFDDFTWITINANTIIGSSASAVLQKCNNMLKWIDDKGVLHQWPCVFQRDLSATKFNYGSEGVAEIGSDTLIKVQLNEETKTIPFNQRFLFNGHAFQVKQINNHISESYMELYLFEMPVQATDDVINNIANGLDKLTPDTNTTLISPNITTILQGEKQSFSVYNYTNGVINQQSYNITANGAILGVNYTFNIIDGNNFEIENILQSDLPIVVTCVNTKNPSDVSSIEIILGGLW